MEAPDVRPDGGAAAAAAAAAAPGYEAFFQASRFCARQLLHRKLLDQALGRRRVRDERLFDRDRLGLVLRVPAVVERIGVGSGG